jgi:hypothetical protein
MLSKEFAVLKTIEKCCSNTAIYEITYNLGTRWLVCNDCLDLEEFCYGTKEKMRILNGS